MASASNDPPPGEELAEAPSHGSVWQLAWPTVIANLLQSTVGLVDVKVVGSLGASAVAAATAGHRLFFVLQAVLMAAVAGTTAFVARAWGAGDHEEASGVVVDSLKLGVLIALIMGATGVMIAEPFAAFLDLAGETKRLAVTYTRWLSCFTVAYAIAFVLAAGLRAAGDTKTPLWIGVIGNVVNIALLYMLVYGGLGAPKLGIAGAAVAGGTAFSAGAVLVSILWLRGRLAVKPLRRRARDSARMRELLRVGYPAALEQFVVQSGFIAFTLIISHYGKEALAAYGIGVQILSLSFVVGFGFSIAASTLVGQHLGAGDPHKAEASGWRAMVFAIAGMSVLSLLIVALARPIAEAMIGDKEVVRLTVAFIYFLGAVQPLMAIDFALGGAVRGAGDTRFPLIATFTGLIIGRVALASLFSWVGCSIEWVYGALIADYVLKAALLVTHYRSKKWQHALAPTPAASLRAEPAGVAK
jgi:putative MATE family efflux protein